MRALLAVLIIVPQVSCLPSAEFECLSNIQCPGGLCEDNGFCSDFDDSCEFGRRFSEHASSDLARECVGCPMEGLLTEDSRCYVAIGEDSTWEQARQGCIAFGSGFELARIDDDDENDLLEDATDGDDYWIGGNDIEQEGDFRWSNGDPIEFFNFGPGQPSDPGIFGEDCILFDGGDGEWDDRDCDDDHDYLCERQ